MCLEEVELQRFYFESGVVKEIRDKVVVDTWVKLFINGEYSETFNTLPIDLECLFLGHLLSEGDIDSIKGIKEISIEDNVAYAEIENIDKNTQKPVRGFKVKANKIHPLMKEFDKKSEIHNITGGTHSAMICSSEGIIHAFAEDVSRHNAVNRVVGKSAMKKIDTSRCILLSSGRQTSSMVSKATNCRIPIIVSRAAPLISGIREAKTSNITLICFARSNRMSLYTCNERIIFPE